MKILLDGEVIKMTVYLVITVFAVLFLTCGVIAGVREFSPNVKTPWEKAEKKAKKIAAKMKKREARRRASGRA